VLTELKEQVWKANLDLAKYKLITLSFGNVSGIDQNRVFVVIKPIGTLQINSKSGSLPEYLLQKHYLRKHGPDAYYGQKKQGAKK